MPNWCRYGTGRSRTPHRHLPPMPEPHHAPETPSRTNRYPTSSQYYPRSGTASKDNLSYRSHQGRPPSFLRRGIAHSSHRTGQDLEVWRLVYPARHGRKHDTLFHLPRRDHLPGFVLLLARAIPRHIGNERTGAVLCAVWTGHEELLRSTVSLSLNFSGSCPLSGSCFLTNALSSTQRSFAFAELYLTIATVFSRYDFKLYDTGIENIQLGSDGYMPIMKSRGGVRVTAKKINHP